MRRHHHASSHLKTILAFIIIHSLCPILARGETVFKAEIVPNVGHTFFVKSVTFAPDGRTVLSGGHDTIVRLWDVKSGRLVRSFAAHSQPVNTVAFSPDGRIALSGSVDKAVNVWDVLTGQLLRKFTEHSQGIDQVVFSPDGRIAISATGKELKRWDTASGKVIQTFPIDHLTCLALSRDGDTAVSGHFDHTLKLWKLRSGQLINTFTGHSDVVTAVALSRDGRLAASVGQDHTLRIWEIATGSLLKKFDLWAGVGAPKLAFSPDDRALALGDGKTLKVWDVASGRLVQTLMFNRVGVTALAFSPDGRQLVVDADWNLRLWSLISGALVQSFIGQSKRIHSLAISPDGQMALSGGDDNAEKLWDVRSGQLLQILTQHIGSVNSVAFSPDGRSAISSSNDNSIRVSDLTSGELIQAFAGRHPGSVVVSPDGRNMLSSSDSALILWDLSSGREIRRFGEKYPYIVSGGFSPDGRFLLSSSWTADSAVVFSRYKDASIRLWDIESGQVLRTFANEGFLIFSLAFAPDGRTALSGGVGDLRLWDISSGKLIRAFEGHTANVTSVEVSSDGRTILSGSSDGTLRLWDFASGRLLQTLPSHVGPVRSAVLSANGQTAIAGGHGGISFWDISTGSFLATTVLSDSDEWVTITPEGFFDASANGAKLLSVVRGVEVYGIDEIYQALYRPDLVREKLAGDPRGLVRDAARQLDLDKVLASGAAPVVSIVTPLERSRVSINQVTVTSQIVINSGGIGRVEWRVNGVTVAVEDRGATPIGMPLQLTRDLVLDEGENEIEVVAHNRSNLVASIAARVTLQAPPPSNQPAPRLFVLAVGLNEYADPKIRLRFAVQDAQAVAEAFAKAGRGFYADVEVTLLRDREVNRTGLEMTFASIAAKVRPSDVFIFFAAGHGKTVDGRYYFIPQDFKLEGVESIRAQGIAQEQWQLWFAQVPAHKSVLLFDTCESATLTGEGKETRALEQRAASGRLSQATGRTIITAATGDAVEGYRGHGLFTYNLIEALARGDSNGNGKIEVGELAAYVYAQVTALSEKVFQIPQEPQIRIVGADYALTGSTLLNNAETGLGPSTKPTHMLAAGSEIMVQPAAGARRVRRIDVQTPVTLIKSVLGWDLIAQNGSPIGYVAGIGLSPIH
jgi:WD40 repeat protein